MSVCLCPEELNFWATELSASGLKKSKIFGRLYGLQLEELKLAGNDLKKCKTGGKKYLFTE